MTRPLLPRICLFATLCVLSATAAYSHSGGIDSQGGHNNKSAGGYHFHHGSLAGKVFATKAAATAALKGEVAPEPTEPPASLFTPLPANQISIASFNIRIYATKSRNNTELALIADRRQQFDLIAIQELRDEEVVQRTLAILAAREHSYEALVSDPVGRGVKERYAFLWRPEKVASLDSGHIVPDPRDLFIREPFYASFRADQFDFTLITIHSIYGDHADDRRFEGMLLDDVYRFVQDSDPEEQDVILLGDFNLPPDDHGFRELTPILTPLFVGDLRSMISESNLYDNIWLDPVHVGEFVGTIGIDYFDETVFGKNDKVASQAVSDHRPIWGVFKVDGPDDDGGE